MSPEWFCAPIGRWDLYVIIYTRQNVACFNSVNLMCLFKQSVNTEEDSTTYVSSLCLFDLPFLKLI